MLAQDAPRVCVVAAAADTGPVHAIGDFPGGALIGAEKGLFLARESGGKVTLARVGDTGPALLLRNLPGGGVLVAAAAGWFVVRESGGRVSATPAGPITIGNVILNARDLGLQIRDLPGGAVLIGAERGVFAAAPSASACATR